MDAPSVHTGARGQQDLDELEAVEARCEVERTVEIAAPLDQQINAASVDAELVPERRTEHVGFCDRAEQRATSLHLNVNQVEVRVKEAVQRACVTSTDRGGAAARA